MSKATAQNYQIEKAPKLIRLLGDKEIQLESAEHIIEFPGGAIEVARTSDGNYWAHILINRRWECYDTKGMRECLGIVLDSRVDDGKKIVQLNNDDQISQIAVLIGRAE